MTTFQNLPFSIRILLDDASFEHRNNELATTLYHSIVAMFSVTNSNWVIAQALDVSESLVMMIREAQKDEVEVTALKS